LPTLFHEPEAPENAPDPGEQTTADPSAQAPEAAVERPCSNCGAPLAEGQEWCLECGTPVTDAARVRGGLPGWRTAAAVIAVTLVMASGAVAAAYAAMRSDDGPVTQTTTDTTAQVATIPQPAPIDIPAETGADATATPPAGSTATPAPVTPPAGSDPLPTPAPTPTYTPPAATPVVPVTPATPAAPTPQPSDGSNPDQGGHVGSSGPVERAKFVPLELDPNTTLAAAYNPVVAAAAATTPPAGTTTDPATGATTTAAPADGTATDPATGAAPAPAPAYAATDFSGEPKFAFDGDPKTAWSVNLPTPALVANPDVGLVIDLGDQASKLRRLTLTPTTPGTTVVVYGSTQPIPPATVKDKGWKKLATQLDVTGKTNITLGDDVTGTGKIRQVLVWFSEGPDDGTSTSVGISELKLYK
jgi:hypothetical protein